MVIVHSFFCMFTRGNPHSFHVFCGTPWHGAQRRKDLFEEELRAAALRLAEGIRRNTSGGWFLLGKNPLELIRMI